MKNIKLPPISRETLSTVYEVWRWDAHQKINAPLAEWRRPTNDDREVMFQFMSLIQHCILHPQEDCIRQPQEEE
jgi:hypothetical protein